MTNWIIGHTDRFQAACSQRSIANWTGMEGTADIGYYFAKGQTGASHREDRDLQWQQSPLRYADHVTTPTLFLHGEEDYRCWKLEAIQMFTALQLREFPPGCRLFPGENHELSRSGRPVSGSGDWRKCSAGTSGISINRRHNYGTHQSR